MITRLWTVGMKVANLDKELEFHRNLGNEVVLDEYIEAGGRGPNHSHPWEHEFFVLSGAGIGEVNNKEANVKQGDVVYVPPDVQHCFRATEAMEVI